MKLSCELYDDEFVKCLFIVLDLSLSSKRIGDGECDEDGRKRRGTGRRKFFYFIKNPIVLAGITNRE
jgi:hypothetical protein